MGSGSSSVDEDSEVTMYQNVKRNSTYQVVALGVLDKETQTLRLCQSLLIRYMFVWNCVFCIDHDCMTLL